MHKLITPMSACSYSPKRNSELRLRTLISSGTLQRSQNFCRNTCATTLSADQALSTTHQTIKRKHDNKGSAGSINFHHSHRERQPKHINIGIIQGIKQIFGTSTNTRQSKFMATNIRYRKHLNKSWLRRFARGRPSRSRRSIQFSLLLRLLAVDKIGQIHGTLPGRVHVLA